MDAVRFGRWFSMRRRAGGWGSQRALAMAARDVPPLRDMRISEDFIARLEAGQLSHPFRGHTRQRVIGLACLLCRTAQETRTYVHAAELGELSVDERTHLTHLTASPRDHESKSALLPPRPRHLIGRDGELSALLKEIRTGSSGWYAISGLPGVGKSVLAAEVMHTLLAEEQRGWRQFPDGLVAVSGAGRHGTAGCISLLRAICALFCGPPTSMNTPANMPDRDVPRAEHMTGPIGSSGVGVVDGGISAGEYGEHEEEWGNHGEPGRDAAVLSQAIDQTRSVLAGKRILVLLDDLEADMPMRPLIEALLATDGQVRGAAGAGSKSMQPTCVLLTTGQRIPDPNMAALHLALRPLDEQTTYAAFVAFLDRPLDSDEGAAARTICTWAAGLPLALAGAASVVTAGIPCHLLATHLAEHPWRTVLTPYSETGVMCENGGGD